MIITKLILTTKQNASLQNHGFPSSNIIIWLGILFHISLMVLIFSSGDWIFSLVFQMNVIADKESTYF